MPTTGSNAAHPLRRTLAWSALAVIGGAFLYSAFARLTGLELSLLGIPVGLAVGQTMYYASDKKGGRFFQRLSAILAFVAFHLTYVPGRAAIALKDGITPLTFAFFVFLSVVSPFIDSNNGFVGLFMVAAGMYLAYGLPRPRVN